MKVWALILIGLLTACAAASTYDETDATYVADHLSCDQISDDIEETDTIIDSATPSETQDIVQDTAVQAARTGVQVSGALGSAGVFAGIGMNFLHRLYSVNAKTRQQEMKDIASARQSILIDAYYLKSCKGNAFMDTHQAISDW